MADVDLGNDRLAQLLQALPPELYNRIYDFTFSANSKEIEIDESYRPPSLLQVSRSTREAFAKLYYSNPTFFCKEDYLLCSWMNSLPTSHTQVLRRVRLDLEGENTEQILDDDDPPPFLHHMLVAMRRDLPDACFRRGDTFGCLYLRIYWNEAGVEQTLLHTCVSFIEKLIMP